MAVLDTILRYNLIIGKLRRNKSTWEELAEYLRQQSDIRGYDFNISQRTFQRDINDIRIIYGIDIKIDKRTRRYYIEEDGSENELSYRMLELLDIRNALNLSDSYSGFIYWDTRKRIGTEALYELLNAIKQRFVVKFIYKKFRAKSPTEKKVEPYALREFKNRWYLLARDQNAKTVKTFALDRLTELSVTKTGFQFPVNFDVEEFYKYSFGIISSSKENAKEVILSFDTEQGEYVKTLPLHESQEILIDNEHELRIKIYIEVTFDLIMEVLSYGDGVEVISPPELVDEIKGRLSRALNYY